MLQNVSDHKGSIIGELYTVLHCIKLTDDGSLVIRNMLEHFKIF